jgi:hypothetical protein
MDAAKTNPNPGQTKVGHLGRSGRSISKTSSQSFGPDSKPVVVSFRLKEALTDMTMAPV